MLKFVACWKHYLTYGLHSVSIVMLRNKIMKQTAKFSDLLTVQFRRMNKGTAREITVLPS